MMQRHNVKPRTPLIIPQVSRMLVIWFMEFVPQETLWVVTSLTRTRNKINVPKLSWLVQTNKKITKKKKKRCQRRWRCSPGHKMATLARGCAEHWSGRRRREARREGWNDIHVQERPHWDGTGNANNLLTFIDRHRLNTPAVRVRCWGIAASRASLLGPLAGLGGGLYRMLSAAPERRGLAAVWQPWKPTSNCTATVTVKLSCRRKCRLMSPGRLWVAPAGGGRAYSCSALRPASE